MTHGFCWNTDTGDIWTLLTQRLTSHKYCWHAYIGDRNIIDTLTLVTWLHWWHTDTCDLRLRVSQCSDDTADCVRLGRGKHKCGLFSISQGPLPAAVSSLAHQLPLTTAACVFLISRLSYIYHSRLWVKQTKWGYGYMVVSMKPCG